MNHLMGNAMGPPHKISHRTSNPISQQCPITFPRGCPIGYAMRALNGIAHGISHEYLMGSWPIVGLARFILMAPRVLRKSPLLNKYLGRGCKVWYNRAASYKCNSTLKNAANILRFSRKAGIPQQRVSVPWARWYQSFDRRNTTQTQTTDSAISAVWSTLLWGMRPK